MEIEFRTNSRGEVFYEGKDGESHRLTKFSTDVVNQVNSVVKDRFPSSYARLATLYAKADPSEREYLMVERFIRCNFGADDHLSHDIEDETFNFEEVKCPLRGRFCPDEGVICKPQSIYRLGKEEKAAAQLYVRGFNFKEIASRLNKSPSTIKVQLFRIKNKLGVKNCREIIKILRLSNI
jgi:DNA-binding CsgD family transcriptional regulator